MASKFRGMFSKRNEVTSKETSVSILKASYTNLDIPSLLEPLGGMQSFVRAGDRVLIKMNLLSPREPDEAVTTHPEIIRAVIREVKKAGGLPYIGDSPAGIFSKRSLKKAYSRTGIEKLALEENVPLNYDTGSRKIEVPDGKKIKKISLCNYLFEADRIISLPKLKTHSYQYMTLACKNMFGVVPGLTKASYHALYPNKMSFADMLLDICQFIKPHLSIMDGIKGMQGQGPAGGDPIEIGLILASTDAISIDITVCKMLGIEPIGIPVLKRAKIRKLWPTKIEYPLEKPENNIIKEFKLPSTASHLKSGKKVAGKNPVITERCILCGECKRICPREAIMIVDERMDVDYSKCIRCYCCHEICPENAIKLGRMKKEDR
jgi:uncharacterized protein (DUF362 family)